MGRTKSQSHAKPANKLSVAESSSSSAVQNGTSSKHTASELWTKAEALLEQDNPELALKFATKAQAQCADAEETCKCSEVVGMCYLELGQERKAKQVRSRCIEGSRILKADCLTPLQCFQACNGKSSVALLYLAQLADSPEEALDCNKAAVDLLSRRVNLTTGSAAQGKDKAWTPEERDTRLQISRALVGMTELYLTDLWYVQA